MSLEETLTKFFRHSHSDVMSLVDVADRTQWNQRALKNWDTQAAQAAALFETQCPGMKKSGEEMGDVFINAGLIASDDSTKNLLKSMQAGNGTTPKAKSGLSKLAWPLATAVLGAGLAYGAAKYLGKDTDTDTASTYQLEQLKPRPLTPDELK